MKNTYVRPNIMAVILSHQTMLAESKEVKVVDDEIGNDDALVKEIDEGVKLSGHTIWDEEW